MNKVVIVTAAILEKDGRIIIARRKGRGPCLANGSSPVVKRKIGYGA